mmetsp:Transcript_102536/g.256933  ORF Transcript_102536/g.256933 Transcript_102536/m.256933 type:complete len:572 (-) Transcript_102536:164-1879(-)
MWTQAFQLLWLLVLSLGTCWGSSKHELVRNQEPVKTFDNTVLGNLQNVGELADLQVPRSHLFSAIVAVGSPPQEMTCLLDSGTADLWIPSKKCAHCAGEHHFHADESKTFMPAVVKTRDGFMPVPVQVSEDGSDIVGFLVQDEISFALQDFKNQSFIIVEDAHLPKDRTWDGVCGLGWSHLNHAGWPLYQNMQHGVEPIFSLVPAGRSGLYSTFISVGKLPQSDIKMETLGWAPVESLSGNVRSYWIASGGLGINAGSPLKARFLVDTATAYMLVPRRHYRNLLRSLFSQQVFDTSCGVDASAGNLVVCDCATTMDAGNMGSAKLTVHLGGREFGLEVAKLFKRVPTKDGGELCLLLVQQSPQATIVVDPVELLAGMLSQGREEKEQNDEHHSADAKKSLAALAPFLLPALVPVDSASVPKETQQRLRRRLQALPAFSVGADPMEDIWVLGGVFLDRFATILDFGGQRLGFAEPNLIYSTASMAASKATAAALYHTKAAPMGIQGAAPTAQNNDGDSGGLSATTVLVVIVLFVGAAGLGNFFMKMQRRKNIHFGPGENGPLEEDPNLMLAE